MKRLLILVVVSLLVIVFAAQAQSNTPRALIATITTADGTEIGMASFAPVTADMAQNMSFSPDSVEGAVAIWVQVQGLTPGFHGIHIHGVGTCDPEGERAFSSAGGHMQHEGQSHGTHMGDLPSLLATEGGIAALSTMTDRLTFEDLMDEDGSAVIIHASPDNFGNIPADRYDPNVDETTMNTGDAGGRFACGVITVAP